MDYTKLEHDFSALSEKEQWQFVLEHKSEITLQLDNDNTTFTFDSEDKTDDCTLFELSADIGDRAGVQIVLQLIGIKAEYV